MSEPCKFRLLIVVRKEFLWTHKEVDLAPHPIVDLVLQVGDAEKFAQHLETSKTHLPWIHFQSRQAGSMFKRRQEKRWEDNTKE